MNLLCMKKITCHPCGNRLGSEVVVRNHGSIAPKAPTPPLEAKPITRKRVAFRCAKYGMKFSTWFVPGGADGRYVLDEVEKHDQPTSIFGFFRARTSAVSEPEAQDDVSAFDLNGWSCPYCQHGRAGTDGAFFHCSCGEFVCGGRSRRTMLGATIYRCHCGAEGRASGTIDQLTTRSVSQAGVSISRQRPGRVSSDSAPFKLLPKK